MRYLLTDERWAILGPLVAAARTHTCGARPRTDDRQFLEALLYWARTGIPWRDLPSEFGRWDGVYNRFRRWEASGTLRRLFEALTDAPDLGDVRRVFVDSTILRAHPHAAGSGKKSGRRTTRG